MTYAAACTDRLRLGCVVFVTPLHQPVHLAKSLASLDQLSRGRLEVGVGIGGRLRPFSAFGIDPDDGLVARFNEGVALMKKLWTEPRSPSMGGSGGSTVKRWRPSRSRSRSPRCGSVAALRPRCAEPSGMGTASSAPGRRRRRPSPNRCRMYERSSTSTGVIRRASGSPSGSTSRWTTTPSGPPAHGRRLVRIYGDFGRQLEPVAVTGPPDACASGLREVAAAGAEMILLNTVFDQTEQMERLAAEVITQVA